MKNRHILILGKSGGGKSELIRQLIRSGMFGSRIILLDPEGEFDDLAGFDTVTVDEVLDNISGKNVFHYRVELLDDETIIDDVNDVCMTAAEEGHCTVICEEIADYSHAGKMRTLWRRGRKRGIVLVGISQRTQDVHKTITSQARTVVMYWDDEPNTLLTIRKRFGHNTMLAVQNLDPEQFTPVIISKGDEATRSQISQYTGKRKGVK